ncbi:MAG: response regulator, partial [Fulvivirga sp.]
DLVHPKSSKKFSETLKHSLKDLRVLLIEDNDINRLYAINILKKWNCIVDGAENGFIGVEKLKSGEYDIILMDVQMPIMDGYEATRTIRKMLETPKNKIPIIALTANAIKGDIDKCKAVGMNDYLSKPFHPEALFKVITKYIGVEKKSVESYIKEQAQQTKLTNLDYLRSVCDGDLNFMNDMVQTFITNTPVAINELQKASDKSDWDQVSKLVHKLKPSITFVGLEKARTIVKKIEESSKENTGTDQIPGKVNELSSLVQKALSELRIAMENKFK